MSPTVAKDVRARRTVYNGNAGRGKRSLKSDDGSSRGMRSEASCPPRATELATVHVKLVRSLGGDERTRQKKVKLT